jgi:hypothetical protein
MSDALMLPAFSAEPLSAIEPHYSAAMVAELWHLDVETVRRLFQNEPGVVVLQSPAKKGKRGYKTLRIPQSVLERVHKRLQR